MSLKFESVLGDRRFKLGEGPHYAAVAGLLYWVDIIAGEVWSLTLGSGAIRRWSFGRPVSAVLPRQAGVGFPGRLHESAALRTGAGWPVLGSRFAAMSDIFGTQAVSMPDSLPEYAGGKAMALPPRFGEALV